MALIVPAILEDTPEAFVKKLALVSKISDVKRIQIDFSDGLFTPRKTIQPGELDVLNPVFEWEAHLMVEKPTQYFFDCKLAGFTTIVVHFESVIDKGQFKDLVNELRDLKVSPGLAIKPDTEVEDILEVAALFDQVLVLGVNPGYQGQEMDEAVPEKVRKLRNSMKNVIIEVDGGVKFSNLKNLSEAGTDLFVVGSALFDPGQNDKSPVQNFEQFSQLLSETKNHGTANINSTTST